MTLSAPNADFLGNRRNEHRGQGKSFGHRRHLLEVVVEQEMSNDELHLCYRKPTSWADLSPCFVSYQITRPTFARILENSTDYSREPHFQMS
jgi:hypothetical protein